MQAQGTIPEVGGGRGGAVAWLRSPRAAGLWHLLSNVALTSVFAVFAAVHLQQWHRTGELAGLGVVIQEGLAATLFLVRRRPLRVSSSPLDWLFAFGGSWLILAARPSGPALFGWEGLALVLQLAGVIVAIAGLGTLGRSFGIVAADRGVRTSGPYRFVRHPLYAAYLVTQIGYVIQNPNLWNLAIVAGVTLCQLGRIRAEEAVLRLDDDYQLYAAQVRYRLVPGLL